MVGVRRRAGHDGPPEVAGHDHVGVGAADPLLGALAEGVDAARPHRAVAAAQAELAVAALGLLGVQAVPHGLDALVPRAFDHLLGVVVDGQPGRGDVLRHRWCS